MDVTSSRLIVAFYLGLGILVAWVGFLSYQRLDANKSSLDAAWDDGAATLGANRAKGPFAATPPPLPASAGVSAELQTIKQLRDMLDKRTALYRQQNEQLATTNAEYARVRDEADKYLGLLAELLTRDAASTDGAPRDTLAPVEAPASDQDASGESAKAVARTEPEMNTTSALEQALVRISDLETLLERETEESSDATRVLVGVGAPAVPALLELLVDDNPARRRWAATVLGSMGAKAKDAEGPLVMALDDADPEVRRAAETAIKLID